MQWDQPTNDGARMNPKNEESHPPAPLLPKEELPESRPTYSPLGVAAIVSFVYFVIVSLYIYFSGDLAAAFSDSIRELQYFELLKGLGFALVTSLLVLFVCYMLFRKISDQQERLLQQRMAVARSERRALAGLFASSIAHDLRNILTVFELALPEDAESRMDADELRLLREAAEEMHLLTKRLLDVGKEGVPGDFQEGRIQEVADRVFLIANQNRRLQNRALEKRLEELEPFPHNKHILTHMLLNLLLNAADATGDDGKIQLRIYRKEAECVMEVHDNGPGISPDLRRRIFEPFFTTKETGRGLGLISAKACAELHHGHIEVIDSDLGGTCFRISLPMRAA